MQYIKRNTKYGVLALFIIILSITISTSTFAKTEVYFSQYDNLQVLSNTFPKPEVQTININTASKSELTKVLKINEPLAQKIINFPFMSFPSYPMSFPYPFMSFPRSRESIILREEPGGFKEPKDLLQISELTNIDLREWEKEGIGFNIE